MEHWKMRSFLSEGREWEYPAQHCPDGDRCAQKPYTKISNKKITVADQSHHII